MGSGSSTVRLTNFGSTRVVVDIVRAGFALDLRGRPRIVATTQTSRSAAPWIAFRPRSIPIRSGASSSVTLTAKVPPGAEPGDHDALLLFTTRRRAQDGVAVRMRIGVVVVLRVPGLVVHRLGLGPLRVTRSGRGRALELLVVNRGNVTERIEGRSAAAELFAGGRRIAKLRVVPRDVRPRTRGLVQFRLPSRARGRITARVSITVDGRQLQRAFRVRL